MNTHSSPSPTSNSNRHEHTRLSAFLLTRHWQDVGSGKQKQMQLYYWLASENGPIRVKVSGQQAVFFVASDDVDRAESLLQQLFPAMPLSWHIEALNLKNFDGKPVVGVYFQTQRNLYIARDKFKEQHLPVFEADIQPSDRFLMERFLTGGMTINCPLHETLKNTVKKTSHLEFYNPKLAPSNYSPKLKVMSLDIETSMTGDILYSIGAYLCHYSADASSRNNENYKPVKRVFMLRSEHYRAQENEALQECDFLSFYETQRELMLAFLLWFNEVDADCIIGWNVINFDLKFLQRVADRLKIQLNLGRANSPMEWRTSRVNEDFLILVIPGRVVLDGIDTLKSATYSFESFALDYVAKELLDRGKLIDDVENRGFEITDLFQKDQLALARYNIEDCVLVWDVFEHTLLLHFALERARLTGLPMDRLGGSVAAFDFRYLPLLHRKGRVAPSLQDDPQGVGSPGGYVMDSKPGLYEHVFVLDFKSLYPSIIRTFHIDPFARVVGHEMPSSNKNDQSQPEDAERQRIFPAESQSLDFAQAIPGFNGAVFAKRGAILPNIIGQLWKERDKAKKQNNQAMSQAVKILMNSFYGVLGTPGCRFFDFRLPSSITLRGHCIMKQTKKLIEEMGYEVIYGDTDSVFVRFKNITADESHKAIITRGQQLAKQLNVWWRDFLHQHYDIPSFLELEFETCFARFVMPTIRGSELGSKKRYAGLILEKEGEQAKLVFKGLEAVRSDWTQLAREFQRELYRRVFYDESIDEYVSQVVSAVYAGECDEKLVYRKRIRRRLDEYSKNVPPHVQAARKADAYRLQKGKKARYQRGGWIRYVLTLNGPEPLENVNSRLDYDLYIERQIRPIVDGIAQFIGTSFHTLTSKQIGLF